MFKISLVIIMSVSLTILGCRGVRSGTPGLTENLEQPIKVQLFTTATSTADNLQNDTPVGQHKIIKADGRITIQDATAVNGRNSVLKTVEVSSSDNNDEKYLIAKPASDEYRLGAGSFEISPSRIAEASQIILKHNQYVHIVATRDVLISDATGKEQYENRSADITVRYKNTLEWFPINDRFTFPILYRFSGSAANFSLDNLAPSVAWALLDWNPESRKAPKYIRWNIMITTFANSNDSSRYSFAISPFLFDFGGWAQLGLSYHFGQNSTFLVLGLTTDILKNLGWSK